MRLNFNLMMLVVGFLPGMHAQLDPSTIVV